MEATEVDGRGASDGRRARGRARARSTRPSTARCSTSLVGHPAARGAAATASRSATSTRPTSATSTTSSTTTGPSRCASTTEIQRRYQGIPWVNSIAADRSGDGLLLDAGRDPERRPTSRPTECNVGAAGFEAARAADPRRLALGVQLGDEPGRASRPGPSRPTRSRRLFRDDYVHNGNDSHWLTNPEEPLDRLRPDHRDRGRRAHLPHPDRPDPGRRSGSPAPTGCRASGFNLRSLEQVALGNRQYLGELWRDELVDALRGGARRPPARLERPGRRLAAPATRSRDWDLRDDLDSNGAILFRRFATEPARQLPVPADRASRARPARARRLLFTNPSTRTPTRSTRPAAGSTSPTRWSAWRSPTRSPT